MKRTVGWSAKALAELDGIFEYIARDNEAAANKVVDVIDNTASKLAEISTGRPGRVEDTYEKSVSGLPYIICYTINKLADGNEEVFILRVIHMARHWPAGKFPH